MEVKKLIFNPLQENTYIVFDNTKKCVIIDPGSQKKAEKEYLKQVISELKLEPEAVLNTHCHFDHIFGNNFLCDEYAIELWTHKDEIKNIARFEASTSLYGIREEAPYKPTHFFENGDVFKFGDSSLEIIHTPGHSPGSVCFYSKQDKFLIAGDTLFAGSIGRTDFPGGDYDLIKESLLKLMKLPGDTTVYCGHGPNTTIGQENLYNPFINEMV